MHEQTGLSRPARVLLVEDDPRAAMMIGETLRTIWPDGLVGVAAVKAGAQDFLLRAELNAATLGRAGHCGRWTPWPGTAATSSRSSSRGWRTRARRR